MRKGLPPDPTTKTPRRWSKYVVTVLTIENPTETATLSASRAVPRHQCIKNSTRWAIAGITAITKAAAAQAGWTLLKDCVTAAKVPTMGARNSSSVVSA